MQNHPIVTERLENKKTLLIYYLTFPNVKKVFSGLLLKILCLLIFKRHNNAVSHVHIHVYFNILHSYTSTCICICNKFDFELFLYLKCR